MAEKEEFEAKQKEVEAVANPIMMKVYQAGGAGAGAGGGAATSGRLQDREVEEYNIRLKPVADGGAECVGKSGYGTGRLRTFSSRRRKASWTRLLRSSG